MVTVIMITHTDLQEKINQNLGIDNVNNPQAPPPYTVAAVSG